MKVDENSFPKGQNMVDVALPKGKVKVLTLASAKEVAMVDPEMRISAEEFEMIKKRREQKKSRYEQGGSSKAGTVKPRVTSRILLSK